MKINGHTIEADRYYSAKEWAEIRGVKIKTLAKRRSERVGEPFVKEGRSVFYRGKDIIAHFEKQLRPTDVHAALAHKQEKVRRRSTR